MVVTVKNAAPADYYFQMSGLESDPNAPTSVAASKKKSRVELWIEIWVER